jgi:TatD DNase family protein
LHISFSGIVTFKNADALREAARIVPADRVLIETDAPFLAPIPYRGKRNEPALVTCTAAVLADVRGEPLERLAENTRRNTERLFGIRLAGSASPGGA